MMQKRSVPNDNDCLFSSFSILMNPDNNYTSSGNKELRRFCADTAASEPEIFADWVLGMSNNLYQRWIQDKFHWGGENEILILATRKYNVEVCVISMESFTKLVYGADTDSDKRIGRIYLLYTGQHYEPLTQIEHGEEIRLFPVGDNNDVEMECYNIARNLAKEKAKLKGAIAKKVIKCCGCGEFLDDTAAFQTHCMEVEHDDDFAYECEDMIIEVDAPTDAPASTSSDTEV
jgi:hypothetical protein